MNDPTNDLYRALAPVMDRLSLITQTAARTRAINQALGTTMTPRDIAALFADEDIDLLLAWSEHG